MACAEWASPSMFSSILFTSFRIAVDIAFMTLSVILYIHINKLFYRIIYYFLCICTKAWLCCLYICAATAVSKYRVMHSFIYMPDMPKLFFCIFKHPNFWTKQLWPPWSHLLKTYTFPPFSLLLLFTALCRLDSVSYFHAYCMCPTNAWSMNLLYLYVQQMLRHVVPVLLYHLLYNYKVYHFASTIFFCITSVW